MFALISLFVIVLASLLVTRVGAVMLTLTGLSAPSARFQARSAFSGAGFTTSESEAVVNHPVRRRIIMALMLLGNAGIVSGMATLLLSFAGNDVRQSLAQILLIVVFMVVLLRVAQSKAVDRALSRLIERALQRFTHVEVRDYAGLLRLNDDWIIGELLVEDQDWFCDRSIEELQLTGEGVLVLGIERADHHYVGTPRGSARFRAGDLAVLYGRRSTIERIDERQHTVDGEMDWVSSQIEFTEEYLAERDRQRAEGKDESGEDEPGAPRLHAGERTGEHPGGRPDIHGPEETD